MRINHNEISKNHHQSFRSDINNPNPNRNTTNNNTNLNNSTNSNFIKSTKQTIITNNNFSSTNHSTAQQNMITINPVPNPHPHAKRMKEIYNLNFYLQSYRCYPSRVYTIK